MIVTLIHGTWAREAAWTKENSPLREELDKLPGVRLVNRFCWEGYNSHRARLRGADRLKVYLLECATTYPDEEHFIIAHSHAGNLVLYALRDERAAQQVRGMVCLSTPFIICKKRDYGRSELWPIVLLALIGFCIAIYRVVGAAVPGLSWMFKLMILPLVSAVLLFVARRFSLPRAAEILESFRLPKLAADRLLLIRAPGDEASVALATSYFVSFLLTKVSYFISVFARLGMSVVDNHAKRSTLSRLKLSIGFLAIGCVFVMLSLHHHGWDLHGWIISAGLALIAFGLGFVTPKGQDTPTLIMVSLWLLTGVLMIVPVLLTMIPASAFGFDTVMGAPFFDLSAESSPPGETTVISLEGSYGKGLSHSAPYSNRVALSAIVSWLTEKK